jgi:hypothetical protein
MQTLFEDDADRCECAHIVAHKPVDLDSIPLGAASWQQHPDSGVTDTGTPVGLKQTVPCLGSEEWQSIGTEDVRKQSQKCDDDADCRDCFHNRSHQIVLEDC